MPVFGQLQTVGMHQKLPVLLSVLHHVPRGEVRHEPLVRLDRRRRPVEPGSGPDVARI